MAEVLSSFLTQLCCSLPVFPLSFSSWPSDNTFRLELTEHFARFARLLGALAMRCSLLVFLVAIYYNMIIAWALFYIYGCFTSELAWSKCGNSFNSENCFHEEQLAACKNASNSTELFWNNTCIPVTDFCIIHNLQATGNFSCLKTGNGSDVLIDPYEAINITSSSEDYFERYMLGVTRDITWENFGTLRWPMVLCLFIAWVMVAACLIKGVQSSGKVVYFTALFPYVILTILFIRGMMLEGAWNGIKFYIEPNWDRLKDSMVWADAANQIFYSLGPAFGGLLTLSSYNPFRKNCHRDAILVSLSNCATSVYAGFVIFSILGYMSTLMNVPVNKVVQSGPGLAFIAYPSALSRMEVPQLWSFLFFFMLVLLGLDSQFCMVETITTAIMDEWTTLRNHKAKVVIGTSVFCFVLALPLCCQGGVYLFTLIDWYSASWSICILAILESIILTWIYDWYGAGKSCSVMGGWYVMENVKEMGMKLNIVTKSYWMFTWSICAPLLVAAILIFSFVQYEPAYYSWYVFPLWANALGWLMAIAAIAIIPLYAIGRKLLYNDIQSWSDFFRPTPDWHPAHEINRQSNGNAGIPGQNIILMKSNYVEPDGLDNPVFQMEKNGKFMETNANEFYLNNRQMKTVSHM